MLAYTLDMFEGMGVQNHDSYVILGLGLRHQLWGSLVALVALGFCFRLGSCIIVVGFTFLPLGYFPILGVGSMCDIQIVVAQDLITSQR